MRFKQKILTQNNFIYLICFLSAIGMITICSKSSFLYPLNDWVDSNCFFTVGKSMMNGVVVYRDLLEQKGPFLYFLHGIAWLISNDTFIGVYFIEIIAAFFFLYFSYKTASLLWEKTHPVMIPVMALIVYTSEAFCHGDSAEELCLPFLAYAIWLSVKSLKEQNDISLKHYFLVGICSGCVFWTKFTIVGFYVGWFILPTFNYVKEKRWKQLGQAVLAVAAGVFAATIPYIFYFGVNGAIGDWLKVYIYDNIFSYSVPTEASAGVGLITNLAKGAYYMSQHNNLVFYLCLIGVLLLLHKKNRRMGIQLFVMLFFTGFTVYMGGRFLKYYSYIFCAFVPFGMAVLDEIVCYFAEKNEGYVNRKSVVGIVLAACLGLAIHLTPNQYLMGVEKQDLPQYQFKEIIEQVENPTLLNYGFLDGGFYTTCNIIPNCKAFCQLNIPLQEMYDLQNDYAEEGLCDFIVTRNRLIEFEKYTCVAESSYMFENIMFTYYLYQLN